MYVESIVENSVVVLGFVDFYWVDFQLSGLGHWVVAGAGEYIDWDIVEVEVAENRFLGRVGGGLYFDLDGAPVVGHLTQAVVFEVSGVQIIGMDFEGFFV